MQTSNDSGTWSTDILLGAWLQRQKVALEIVVPSLVQQRPLPSTLGSRSRSRRSPSYERVYGPLEG